MKWVDGSQTTKYKLLTNMLKYLSVYNYQLLWEKVQLLNVPVSLPLPSFCWFPGCISVVLLGAHRLAIALSGNLTEPLILYLTLL